MATTAKWHMTILHGLSGDVVPFVDGEEQPGDARNDPPWMQFEGDRSIHLATLLSPHSDHDTGPSGARSSHET